MNTQGIRIGGPAMADHPGIAAPVSFAAFLADKFNPKRLLAEYVRNRALRRAENELMALDDRMLSDIGLDRTEIGSAVRNPGQERLNGARLCMSFMC